MLIKENTKLAVKETRGRAYIKKDGNPGTAVDWLLVDLKKGNVFGALASNPNIKESEKTEKMTADPGEHILAGLSGSLEFLAAQDKELPWYKTAETSKVKVKVDMPWGVAAVRGSFWENTVTDTGCSTSLLQGDAEVSAGGRTQPLPPGRSSAITPSNPVPTTPVPMTAQQVTGWVHQGAWLQNVAQTIQSNQETVRTEALITPVTQTLAPGQPAPPAPVVPGMPLTPLAPVTPVTLPSAAPAIPAVPDIMNLINEALTQVQQNAGFTNIINLGNLPANIEILFPSNLTPAPSNNNQPVEDTSSHITPVSGISSSSEDFLKGSLQGVECETIPGQLQLAQGSTSLPYIWVPNSDAGTVSKIDTITGKELGRYYTGPPSAFGPCLFGSYSVAIDGFGDCWVGNMNIPTILKIGLPENEQFIDRNGNGVLDTSSDLNDNGIIDLDEILPWGQDELAMFEVVIKPGYEGTYFSGADNNIYYSNPITINVSPSTIAIDENNNVWAGCQQTRKYYYINGLNGQIIKTLDLSTMNHSPHTAVIDANGILWSGSEMCNPWDINHLLRLDPKDNSMSPVELMHSASGLALDNAGHLWVTGDGPGGLLTRINISTAQLEYTLNHNGVMPANYRAVAVGNDNNIWIVDAFNRNLIRMNNDGTLITTIPVASSQPAVPPYFSEPSGLAIDGTGKVWVADMDGSLKIINSTDNTIERTLMIGSSHFVNGDMTRLVNKRILNSSGNWTAIYQGKAAGAHWDTISWIASQPVGTSVTVKARTSDDQCNWSAWFDINNGIVLPAALNGKYLQVDADLQVSQGNISPALYVMMARQTGDAAVSAAQLAAELNHLPVPQTGDAQLLMPTLPTGFTVGILSSSNPGIIAVDGSMSSPENSSSVNLVLQIKRLADNTTADSKSISVNVPGKVKIDNITASNGKISITLSGITSSAPVLADFAASLSIGGGTAAPLTLQSCIWHAAERKVYLSFTSLTTADNTQSLLLSCSYRGQAPVTSIAFRVCPPPVAELMTAISNTVTLRVSSDIASVSIDQYGMGPSITLIDGQRFGIGIWDNSDIPGLGINNISKDAGTIKLSVQGIIPCMQYKVKVYSGSFPAPTIIAESSSFAFAGIQLSQPCVMEAPINNGSFNIPLQATLYGGLTFADDMSGGVSIEKLPAGLGISVQRKSDTQLTISFTGQATNHTMNDSIWNALLKISQDKVNGATAEICSDFLNFIFRDDAGDCTAPVYQNAVISNGNKRVSLLFSEPLLDNTGGQLKNSVSLAVYGTEYFSLAAADVVSINGSSIVIDFANSLSGDNNRIKLASNSVRDMEGNILDTVVETDAIIEDTTNPILTSTSPVNGASGVAVDTNIVLEFNEAVCRGSGGSIEIYKTSNDQYVEGYGISNDMISGHSVTINRSLSALLCPNTSYYIKIWPGAFKDAAGNDYEGISDKTTWSFTTN